jgi:hypothetical protein
VPRVSAHLNDQRRKRSEFFRLRKKRSQNQGTPDARDCRKPIDSHITGYTDGSNHSGDLDSAAKAQEEVILFRARCAEGMIGIYSNQRLPFEFIGRIQSAMDVSAKMNQDTEEEIKAFVKAAWQGSARCTQCV